MTMTLKRNQFGQYSTNRNYKLVTVTLDQETLEALESLKTLTGLKTNSSLIRHVIKQYNESYNCYNRYCAGFKGGFTHATTWKVTDIEVNDYGKEEDRK